MPNLTARQMLSRIPVRMAEGGQAQAFSDDEVKQFIQSTYAQFGGPSAEAHRAIGDAMAQYGVGVDQVARASGFSAQEVEAELMGQRAAAQQQVLPPPTPPEMPQVPVLPDSRGPSGSVALPGSLIGIPNNPPSSLPPVEKTQGYSPPDAAQRLDMLIAQDQAMAPVSGYVDDMMRRDISGGPALPPVQAQAAEQQGTAAGVSAAYRKAMGTGGQQTVGDYYANLRADAAAYLANPNAPTGVDAYNQLIQSGISTSDLRAAGVADDVLNKIFTVSGPIEQSKFTTPTGMTSAYERSPDLAFESQRLGQEGRAILDKQGRDYVANLQKDGIDAAERAQMLEYATERGYSFDDLRKAGVDANVLFKDDGSAAAAKAAADKAAAAAEAERLRLAGIAAAKAAADKAAADAAAEQKRLMDIKIAEEAERVRQAAAKAAADKAAADAAAKAAADKAAADAAVVAPGVTTGDIVGAVTPKGPTAAELQAAIDAANAAAAKTAADARAIREAQEAAERARIAALTGAAVTAVTPSYNAQQLQNIIKAAESKPAAEGTVTNPVDTRGSAATGTQSGVSKFLETYNPAAPFVAPAYTAPTVYAQLPARPDIFAAGQAALDTTFNQSPRTAIPDMPGQFDYSPAAKLRPATGAGFTFTPPSITTRPRSLLSPREIQAYGGTMSASQRFAQNRSLIDRNLRDMIGATPALRNASTYNLLRNRIMSGDFNTDPYTPSDPLAVFRPNTPEAQKFQAFLASLAGAAPAKAAATGAATGTVADAVVDIDQTDRQIAAGAGTTSGSTVAGGYAAPIDASPLAYGGYRLEPFKDGGEATSSRRMLESLFGKKSDGSARDQLPRFQAGGDVSARTPLSLNDPLYIRQDSSVSPDELLRRQLEAIDNAPSARTADPEIEQTESRSMLDRLKGAGSAVNRAFYENISKPAVGAAVDMTVGLGDLAQMGARYLGDRAGMDTGEFTPAAPRVREALGVEGYDPYAIGSIATQILPFAAAGRTAVSAPTAARQLETMFPNLGRESGAYVGGESAASIAREVAPESTAAELLAGVAGGMGGASAMGSPAMSRIDAPAGDEPLTGSAASMLDELDAAAGVESLRPDITSDIGGRKRVGTTGKYVGAPEGVRTPQKLAALTRSITSLAKEGEFGKFWYERSGRQILDLTNGNKDDAEKIIQAIAITSANTPVAANFDFAIQAYYQWKNGQPIETGMYTTAMSKKLQKMFDGEDWAGRKTNNFYNNLMRSVDTSKVQGVTTDLWMMRAFGFDKDAPTDAQYSFVENETKRIAQNLGWEPQQVQAAIWVALKSRMENSGVKKSVEEKSLKNGWLKYNEDGERVILDKNKHAANWLDTAMKYSPNEADREAAKFDYANAAENNLAQVSWESIPSRTSGHMSEIFNAPRQVVQDYHTSISKAFLDDNGNDQIAVQLGILSPGDFEAPGYFEGLTSPGTQTELTLPRAYGVTRRISEIKKQAKLEGWEKSKLDAAIREATYATEPAAKDLMMAYAAARGILLKQDGVGMHRPSFFTGMSRPKANGYQVDIGRPLTANETSQIARLVAEEAGHTEYNPIGSPNGVRFINFDYLETPNLDFQNLVSRALNKAKFDNDEQYDGIMFGADTGYLGNNWTENLNGEGYFEAGGLAGRPDLQRKIRDIVAQLAPRVSAVEDEFSNRYGWTRNTALNRLYEPEAQVSSPSGLPQVGTDQQSPNNFAKGGAVTSSRQMLNNLIGKKPEGQRVDATGLQRFANGGEARVGGSAPAVAGRTGRAAQLAAQRAADPQTESRTMLEQLGRFTSLDTPPEMGLGETVADIGMGFLPVVGTAQGARDFERARRDEDKLGMLLSAASMIPVAGGAVRAVRSAGKAADVVEEVPGAARQMLDEVAPPATTEQIKQVESSAPAEKSPVPSYYMDEWTQETGLSPQEIENFWRLGDNQRGLPEHLMVKAQRVLGGGVLFPAIEHIGDLTNRMTPKHSLGFAYEETLGKAQRYLRSLKSGYGFRREFEENLRNNAQFNNESLGEHRSKVNAALDAYADAHEKLVTYNPLQTLARDAAVSLGRRDFEKAATLLQDFVDRIPTKEDFVAEMRFTPEPDLTKLSSRELKQKLQDIQEKRRARQGLEGSAPTPAVPTQTPEFKNFFGESKVTDAGGQPLVVYHGTGSDFTTFRPSESGLLGRGIYLSSEKRVAEGFRGADKLMPIYASMQNPAYEHDLIPKRVGDKMKGDEYEKELHDRAIDGGFDGIIKGSSTDVFGNPRTPDSWGNFVVFEPTQIKSATDNVGTFDPSTPVITKAKGGTVTKKAKSNVERVRNDNRRYL